MRKSLAERFTVESMMRDIGAFYARLVEPSDRCHTSGSAAHDLGEPPIRIREPSP